MSPVVELLQRLDRDGFSLSADGDRLILAPGSRLTPELEAEILRHKPDLLELAGLHGPSLANLFRDPPTWPRPCGRSGFLADPDAILRAIRRPVRLRDGRDGILRRSPTKQEPGGHGAEWILPAMRASPWTPRT